MGKADWVNEMDTWDRQVECTRRIRQDEQIGETGQLCGIGGCSRCDGEVYIQYNQLDGGMGEADGTDITDMEMGQASNRRQMNQEDGTGRWDGQTGWEE